MDSDTLITIGDGGVIRLDDVLGRCFGLLPGTEWTLEQAEDGLRLRRRADDPRKVYIEATNACNLSCRTCIRNVWQEPLGIMSDATFARVLEQIQALPSVRTVHFGGFGEPLGHPRIFEMLHAVKALGLRTELITNGTLLDEAHCDRLVAADLDLLVVSIDGAREPTNDGIRLGSELNVVLRNLNNLSAARYRVRKRKPDLGLSFVAMKDNLEELLELKNMAAQLRVSFIMVTNVLAHTEELREQMLYGTLTATSQRRSPKPSRQDALVMLPRIDFTERTTEVIRRLIHAPGNVQFAGLNLNGAVHYCRFVQEDNVFVRWDGEVAPCMALLHSYPTFSLRGEKRIVAHSFGSIHARTLGEIWAGQEYRDFRTRVRKFDFAPCVDCGGCEMADSNRQDCFGNPAPVCGDCLWAQGIIQCP